jgi:putative DNA methylase
MKKKLIEVALPLEAINEESGRRKRKAPSGYPTGIHKWWAQRPLAACRAVLLASLLDDPSSDPDRFPTQEEQDAERQRLFRLIEEAISWDRSGDLSLWRRIRNEIERCADGLVAVDPFAGGGSIPLESQRLGLRVSASDLNPVAVLITKALTELPWNHRDARARFGTGLPGTETRGVAALAADVRAVGRRIVDELRDELASLFPVVRSGSGDLTAVAWLWCRTVRCPNPACAGEAPLIKTVVVSTKGGKTWLDPVIDRHARRVDWKIREGGQPTLTGTVTRSGARCLICEEPIPLAYIRGEGRSGRIGARLLCVVAQDGRRRLYVEATREQESHALECSRASDAPITELPEQALSFRVQAYGYREHADLFTNRQLATLLLLASKLRALRGELQAEGVEAAYADAVITYLAFAVSRLADYGNTFASWRAKDSAMRSLFSQQSVPMVWDYAEANPLGPSSGGFLAAVEVVAKCVEALPASAPAVVDQRDAATLRPPAGALVCTDPPYYDNIGYSDLSDFFYVWLRESLKEIYPDLFSTVLAPKSQELVATPFRFDGNRDRARRFFEDGFRATFEHVREAQSPDIPTTVFYAFKQAESEGGGSGNVQVASTGWETMLEGLIRAGLMVTGTWPMRTEGDNRQIGVGANALASSIVLVCRPRPANARLATRRELTLALRDELPTALNELQHSNIAPVDLAQASIGPGMAVFSRFARVVEADGSQMSVRDALALINHVLDELLASQEGDFDAETRWAIAWFEQFGMNPGPFGVAETLSKAKNTAVNALETAGVLVSRCGKVRLLDREELPVDWRPETHARLTLWEVVQHMIRTLEAMGETAAADLIRRVGGLSESARELAYRLYTICDRKGWAEEAAAYNSLVVVWPELTRLAAGPATPATQMELS